MKWFLGGQKGWTHKVPWRTSPWSLVAKRPVSRRPTMSESQNSVWIIYSTRLGVTSTYQQSAPSEGVTSKIDHRSQSFGKYTLQYLFIDGGYM